jgi:hypothetical protein
VILCSQNKEEACFGVGMPLSCVASIVTFWVCDTQMPHYYRRTRVVRLAVVRQVVVTRVVGRWHVTGRHVVTGR